MAIHPKQGVGEGPEISAVQPWRCALGLENSLCSVLCCGVDVATAITFLQPLGVKKYPIHKKAEFRKGHPSSTLMVYVMPGYNFKVLRRENCLSSRFWALPFLKHAGPQSPFFCCSPSGDSRENLGTRGGLRVQGTVHREMVFGSKGLGKSVHSALLSPRGTGWEMPRFSLAWRVPLPICAASMLTRRGFC